MKKKEKVEMPMREEKLAAKKDFVLLQNDVHIIIKAGDNLTGIPKRFMENLKAEGVI